ncbi:hypothetical protein FOZ63_020182 [Perkinsus olseni]|uniref:BZIP domain-containing protein n=1 Tax=Perkinsus olseni TaxID=32597 RepID=A0A7J6SIZ1_PEROL|nr:hypothetical protein FOZ63_020182 [Perkinsus olseni]KAF4755032.1 hypothetical protein FOZ62_013570 [Perkinsus olseni]
MKPSEMSTSDNISRGGRSPKRDTSTDADEERDQRPKRSRRQQRQQALRSLGNDNRELRQKILALENELQQVCRLLALSPKLLHYLLGEHRLTRPTDASAAERKSSISYAAQTRVVNRRQPTTRGLLGFR